MKDFANYAGILQIQNQELVYSMGRLDIYQEIDVTKPHMNLSSERVAPDDEYPMFMQGAGGYVSPKSRKFRFFNTTRECMTPEQFDVIFGMNSRWRRDLGERAKKVYVTEDYLSADDVAYTYSTYGGYLTQMSNPVKIYVEKVFTD